MNMKLVVGLGNPGKEYENTRHNTGRIIVGILEQKLDSKHKIKFLTPDTFMNNSGKAVAEILKFYPGAQLIVVHDELDLELGSMRIQKDVSSAGHNGVQSIIDQIDTSNFVRVRLGIDNPQIRGQIPADEFVLQKFKPDEEDLVKEVLGKAKDAIETIQTQGLEIAQSKFNG